MSGDLVVNPVQAVLIGLVAIAFVGSGCGGEGDRTKDPPSNDKSQIEAIVATFEDAEIAHDYPTMCEQIDPQQIRGVFRSESRCEEWMERAFSDFESEPVVPTSIVINGDRATVQLAGADSGTNRGASKFVKRGGLWYLRWEPLG